MICLLFILSLIVYPGPRGSMVSAQNTTLNPTNKTNTTTKGNSTSVNITMPPTTTKALNRLCPGPTSLIITYPGTKIRIENTTVTRLRDNNSVFDMWIMNDSLINATAYAVEVKDYITAPTTGDNWDEASSFVSLLGSIEVNTNISTQFPNQMIRFFFSRVSRLRLVDPFEIVVFRVPATLLECTPHVSPDTFSLRATIRIMNDESIPISSAALLRVASFVFCIVSTSLSCTVVTQSSVLTSMVECTNPIMRLSHLKVRWIVSPFLVFESTAVHAAAFAVIVSVVIVTIVFGFHYGYYSSKRKTLGSEKLARSAAWFPNISTQVALFFYPSIAIFTCRVVFEESTWQALIATLSFVCAGLPAVVYSYHRGRHSFPLQWYKFFATDRNWFFPQGGWVPINKYCRYGLMFDDFQHPYPHFTCVTNIFISAMAAVSAVNTRSRNSCRIEIIVSTLIYVCLLFVFARFRPFRSWLTSILASVTVACLVVQNSLQLECLNHTENPLHWCEGVLNIWAVVAAVAQLLWSLHAVFVSVYTWVRFFRPNQYDKNIFQRLDLNEDMVGEDDTVLVHHKTLQNQLEPPARQRGMSDVRPPLLLYSPPQVFLEGQSSALTVPLVLSPTQDGVNVGADGELFFPLYNEDDNIEMTETSRVSSRSSLASSRAIDDPVWLRRAPTQQPQRPKKKEKTEEEKKYLQLLGEVEDKDWIEPSSTSASSSDSSSDLSSGDEEPKREKKKKDQEEVEDDRLDFSEYIPRHWARSEQPDPPKIIPQRGNLKGRVGLGVVRSMANQASSKRSKQQQLRSSRSQNSFSSSTSPLREVARRRHTKDITDAMLTKI
eukprot:PhF_6_TR26165/c0_g1_i1/m.37146